MNDPILTEFLQQAVSQLEDKTQKIGTCLQELTEEEIWQRPNKSSNSVGNLILHLCGNITQYIISSLGETEDKRERDKEFSTPGGRSKKELFDLLTATVANVNEVINHTDPQKALHIRSVQGFEYSAIAIILHVVEHFSYHTGQIIFWVKLLKDKDLGFYANLDLNKKNII